MAEPTERMNAKILYSNLTRNGSVDKEFRYFFTEYVSSLGSQVHIHLADVLEGTPEEFTDGAWVEFLPERLSDEEYDEYLNDPDKKTRRRYRGLEAKLVAPEKVPVSEPGATLVESNTPDPKVESEDADLKEGSKSETEKSSEEKSSKPKSDTQKKSEPKTFYTLVVEAMGSDRFNITGTKNGKAAELTYVVSAVGPESNFTDFTVLNGDRYEFVEHHPGLTFEDGTADIKVSYKRGSLDIVVRCIESNLTRYETLWK